MKVLVLAGGSSDEREVSLRSGSNVATALKLAGHSATLFDPADSPQSLAIVAVQDYDVVFPALHGSGGEDGTVQAQLDRLAVAYVGSNVDSSELCFDKWNYRALLAAHGLPVARGQLVDSEMFWQSDLISEPFVLKPPKGGSSIDTILVHDPNNLPKAAIEADFSKHVQLLVEALAPGVEITVGVVGAIALPVIEIIPPAGQEFDYANKYNGKSQELCPPQHIDVGQQIQAQNLTTQIHKLCGCRDMSRTDMIVGPKGELTVLETNTIPGLTEQSLLPKAAAAAGVSMAELCDRLVKMALSRQAGNA